MKTETSRADELAAALRAEILGGRYRVGDRLPSERELAARSEVNRLCAREALQQLERLGLVEIRRGGPRVAAIHAASPDLITHLFDAEGPVDAGLVAQWLDVGEIMITGAVRLALERGSDSEIERARELLSQIVKAEDESYFDKLDALGDLIFAGTGNLMLQLLRNGLKANVFERVREMRAGIQPVRVELAKLMRVVDEAVAARDPERAQEATRQLLRASRESILKSLPTP